MLNVIRHWLYASTLIRSLSMATVLMVAMLLPVPVQAQAMKACFYEDADHGGRSYCVVPGKLRDTLPPWIDRKISSATIPRGLKALMFSEQIGEGRGLGINSDLDYWTLKRIGMNDTVRSLQVSRTYPDCTRDCRIRVENAFDLATLFQEYWAQSRAGHASLAFNMHAKQQFNVDVFGVRVRFGKDFAAIETRPTFREPRVMQLDSVQIDPVVSYGVVALVTDGRNFLSVQVILTDKDRRYVRSTPVITRSLQAWDNAALAIHNTVTPGRSLGPLSLASASFAGEKLQSNQRVRRGTNCSNYSPILTIVNYFAGFCSSPGLEGLYAYSSDPQVNILTLVAGEAPRKTAALPAVSSHSGIVALLDNIVGTGQNPMAIHAAARVCKTSLAKVIHSRQRRGVDDVTGCAYQTAAIITLYQAAFGQYWNQRDFSAIIDNIRRTGSAGYPTTDADSASRLALAVWARMGELDQITRSFQEANVLYEQSTYGTLDFEDIVEQYATARAATPPGPGPSRRFSNVSETATAALGFYTLDMRDYVRRHVWPRIRTNGQWVENSTDFSVEILRSGDQARLEQTRQILAGWETEFAGAANTASSSDPMMEMLLVMGVAMSDLIQGSLQAPESDLVTVVVSYQSQIVSVLQGNVRDNETADLSVVVSRPSNVVLPYTEGAVRGAGARAMREFLDHARTRGVRTVHMHAATEPSGRVAQSTGFRLIDEL